MNVPQATQGFVRYYMVRDSCSAFATKDWTLNWVFERRNKL